MIGLRISQCVIILVISLLRPWTAMTELLERAIARLKTLPTNDQDAIAAMILEELENEVRWDTTLANSQEVLARLAAEAMAEYRAGTTQELDPETL